MSERSKEHAWKACIGETLSGVQIPFSPPVKIKDREIQSSCLLLNIRIFTYGKLLQSLGLLYIILLKSTNI